MVAVRCDVQAISGVSGIVTGWAKLISPSSVDAPFMVISTVWWPGAMSAGTQWSEAGRPSSLKMEMASRVPSTVMSIVELG